MTQPRARSSSLQRSFRAGSVKRGPRGSTPRRLSDLQERPAWDATSSNLERFKLSAEEQERRKASRVSKNRALASSDSKRSFVEAWAKHVTKSVMLREGEEEVEDTEPDQDRPRSSTPVARDLPINYCNVVEMLRKSPSAAAAAAARASGQGISDRTAHSAHQPPPCGRPAAASSGPVGPASGGASSSSCSLKAESSSPAASSPNNAGEEPSWLSAEASVRPFAAEGPSAPTGMGAAAAAGPRSGAAPAGHAAQGRAATAGAAGRDAGGPLHRGDVSVTPAAMRPRFNPADATTIIAFGEESDEDQEDDVVARGPRPGASGSSPMGAGGAAAAAAAAAADGSARCQTDPMTVAFEAAMFGRVGPQAPGSGASAGVGGGGGAPMLAWETSRSAASPIDAAATDVELRLRALEGALLLGRSGGGGVGDGGLAPEGGSALQEEVAELRRELRQVRSDNAKLRQELSAFSTRAGSMLTQLQAQVQQLLRSSGGGSDAGSGRAALPAPKLQQAPPSRQPQNAPAPGPTGTAAAAHSALTDALYGDAHGARQSQRLLSSPPPQPQPPPPYVPSVTAHHQPQFQSVVRRNIFADLDISSLRPLGTAAGTGGGGGAVEVGSAAATPSAAGGGYRPPMPSSSPLIDVGNVSCAPCSMVVRDVDDAEVALPSFAAFRRSAGAASFTSARPGACSANPAPPNSHNIAPAAVAHSHPGPDPPRAAPPVPSTASAAAAAVQQRTFPTQYQPRSLGGVIVRPVSSNPAVNAVGVAAAASAGGANAASGAYVASVAASAANAAATGSDAAAAALARSHCGLPQPLVFSVGPEFRSARASGLTADNSMSLSAHTAAATARSKASVPPPPGAMR